MNLLGVAADAGLVVRFAARFDRDTGLETLRTTSTSSSVALLADDLLFADGFESGDTSASSRAAPSV